MVFYFSRRSGVKLNILFHGVDVLCAPNVNPYGVVAPVELVGPVVAGRPIYPNPLNQEAKGEEGEAGDGPKCVRFIDVVVMLKHRGGVFTRPLKLNSSNGPIDAVFEFVCKDVEG